MTLKELGYNDDLEKFRISSNLQSFDIGRVVAEHKERYIVKTINGDYDAEITGNIRFTASSREDFPAVGDWVAISIFESDLAIIHAILPRSSTLKRRAVGHFAESQVIATNVDYAFVVQALDRDFSINRLERYLTLCYTSGVRPIIILTKVDLADNHKVDELVSSIKSRIKNVLVIPLSNFSKSGFNDILKTIHKGKTYCMLGSSGVGKSTLLNNLVGEEMMKTGTISQATSRGKHVTSHRELIVIENGGMIIDNPGMREVGLSDSQSGIEIAFDVIDALSQQCKYKDCTHTAETGCAVITAVENGEIDNASYQNFLKLMRERAHFETTVSEKKRKEKIFGKVLKNYKKDKRNLDL